MKKILSVILLSTMALCILSGCGSGGDNTEVTMPTVTTTETTVTETTTEGNKTEPVTEEIERVDPKDVKVIPIDVDPPTREKCLQEDISGFRDLVYDIGEDENGNVNTYTYDGGYMTFHVELSAETNKTVSMGVYLTISGVQIPFTMRQCSDASFETKMGEETSKDTYHQLWFSDKNNYYFLVKFKPDMFKKGDTIYPQLVFVGNDSYLPDKDADKDGTVDYGARMPFESHGVKVVAKCDGEKTTPEVDTEYTTEPMPSDYYDDNDNGYPKIIFDTVEGYGFQKISKSDDVTYKITGYTANFPVVDEFANQKVRLYVLVNNKLYPAFNGKYYCDMTMNDCTYYYKNFTVKGKDLEKMNSVMVCACRFQKTEADGGDSLISTEPLYIQVN